MADGQKKKGNPQVTPAEISCYSPSQLIAYIKAHPINWEVLEAKDPSLQDYTEYLKTALWKKIRRRILKRDNYKCSRCGGKANQVHHRCYTRIVLEGRDDNQLVSVCRGCHKCIEFDEHGAKRSGAEKERILQTPAPTDIPSPCIAGKKLSMPPNADRLSAIQFKNYFAAGIALLQSRGDESRRKKEQRRIQVGRDPIESNLHLTDQIVWVLHALCNNQPTQYADFARFLPDEIVDRPAYWLKKAAELMEWHNPECKRIMQRVFTARVDAVERLLSELATERFVEIPGKNRSVRHITYARLRTSK